MDMTLEAILERVECGMTTVEDAARLRRWIVPDLQTDIVKCYYTLICHSDSALNFIASDLRQGLAAELTKDLSNETTK